MPEQVTVAKIKAQLSRFASYSPQPNGTEIADLVKVWQEESNGSLQHCQAIGDELKRACQFFPKVVDICEAAVIVRQFQEAHDSRLERSPLDPPTCGLCKDTGFVSKDRNGYAMSTPCSCRPVPEGVAR